MNRKRQAFVAEYIKDFNATRAARAVGYSPKTARAIGQKLLTFTDVDTAIQAEIKEHAMEGEEILQRLGDIARGDVAELMDITTQGFSIKLTLKDPVTGEITVNPKTKLIKKIKQKVTTFLGKNESAEDREVIETEIELYSAVEAMGLLGKNKRLFIDRTEVTGAAGGPLEVVQIYLPSNGREVQPDA
jgi:phage terminase small subunit